MRPLRLPDQRRELQRSPEREREAAGARLHLGGGTASLAHPQGSALGGGDGLAAGLDQGGVARLGCEGVDAREERAQRAVSGDGAERVEREHVGRALPDREHLRVAEEQRQPGVLDVAGAAERLEDLAGHGHRLARRGELA